MEALMARSAWLDAHDQASFRLPFFMRHYRTVVSVAIALTAGVALSRVFA
jgi:hypothetical protein